MTLARILRLVCSACGYRPPQPRVWRRVRALYPSGNGEALCDRCAYDRGMLSGKERQRYMRRHPLRAAWLAATR